MTLQPASDDTGADLCPLKDHEDKDGRQALVPGLRLSHQVFGLIFDACVQD